MFNSIADDTSRQEKNVKLKRRAFQRGLPFFSGRCFAPSSVSKFVRSLPLSPTTGHLFPGKPIGPRHFFGGRRKRLRKAEANRRPMKMLKERI